MNVHAVPNPAKPTPTAYCGAAAGRNKLVLITIERDGDRFSLLRNASAQFVLMSDTQPSLRQFQHEIAQFVNECSIGSVVLRGGQRKGNFACGPEVNKMEAALELVEGIRVRKVHHNSLRSWKQFAREELPRPNPNLPLPEAILHEEAILAARLSYGIHEDGDKLVQGKIK